MKIPQEIGIPDNLTCLLRNLYAGQEATARSGHGTTDWFQIGKGVCQGYILLPCFFKYKLESKLPGEISITSITQIICIISVFKSRDITLLTKVHIVKAMVFPVVTYRCESWTIKKAEHQRIDVYTVLLEKTLKSPLDNKEIKPVHPKGNQP